MRVALDTNVLVYAEGIGDATRHATALELVEKLPAEQIFLPAQTLGELYPVLSGKAGFSAVAARESILSWADSFAVGDSTQSAFLSACDLCCEHGLQIWDALILSVAAENRCRLLLSEDLHQGFTWRGITVVNPFATTLHPLLESLLEA